MLVSSFRGCPATTRRSADSSQKSDANVLENNENVVAAVGDPASHAVPTVATLVVPL